MASVVEALLCFGSLRIHVGEILSILDEVAGRRSQVAGHRSQVTSENRRVIVMFDGKMLGQLVGGTVRKDVGSVVGEITLLVSEVGLQAVLWEPHRQLIGDVLDKVAVDEAHEVIGETEKQLGEYFEGERTAFDVPLDLQGTGFQKAGVGTVVGHSLW